MHLNSTFTQHVINGSQVLLQPLAEERGSTSISRVNDSQIVLQLLIEELGSTSISRAPMGVGPNCYKGELTTDVVCNAAVKSINNNSDLFFEKRLRKNDV